RCGRQPLPLGPRRTRLLILLDRNSKEAEIRRAPAGACQTPEPFNRARETSRVSAVQKAAGAIPHSCARTLGKKHWKQRHGPFLEGLAAAGAGAAPGVVEGICEGSPEYRRK